MQKLNITYLEPFYSGSHKRWIDEYASNSVHNINVLGLEGDGFWKQRVKAGSIKLAKTFLKSQDKPDILLASSMLDLSSFLSITRQQTARIRTAIYFHENQLSYPWSKKQREKEINRRDFGFINYTSSLVADKIFFNSSFHKCSYLRDLDTLLNSFEEFKNIETLKEIEEKSSILYLGLALKKKVERVANQVPVILWNHRWEYDKNPEEFFKALRVIKNRGIDFKLILLGSSQHAILEVFNSAKEEFAEEVIHFGYLEDIADYQRFLSKADILPVTSKHDFFGGSVVEAIHAGCFPILPKRLSYPELIDDRWHSEVFYHDFDELVSLLEKRILEHPEKIPNLSKSVEKFSWSNLINLYDSEMIRVLD